MYNLYCDKCFNSVLISPTLKFYLGEGKQCSSHVFCENCVNEKCSACGAPYQKIEINDKMESTLLSKFSSLDNLKKIMDESIKLHRKRYSEFNERSYQTVFQQYRKVCEHLKTRSERKTGPTNGRKVKGITFNATENSFRNAMDKNGEL